MKLSKWWHRYLKGKREDLTAPQPPILGEQDS